MEAGFIILSFEGKIGGNYKAWTVGVTDGPARRNAEHGFPLEWHQWDADSEYEARNIEDYFLEKGCNGGSGGPGKADYVYIYK